MNIYLAVRLLSAHVVGDFLLQSRGFCEAKKELKTWKGWCCQSLHALIQALLTYLFVGEWECWLLPIVVLISHFLLDVGKSLVGSDNLLTFVVDQALHFAVLSAIYSLLLKGSFQLIDVSRPHAWVVVFAYLLVLMPASIFIEKFNQRFDNHQDGKSLTDGGKHIGYLERILIVSFILCGWMEGIGYLLAAKSVFRFGDLKNNKDLKHTEYVLVGTLLSFTIAVLIGAMAAFCLGEI